MSTLADFSEYTHHLTVKLNGITYILVSKLLVDPVERVDVLLVDSMKDKDGNELLDLMNEKVRTESLEQCRLVSSIRSIFGDKVDDVWTVGRLTALFRIRNIKEHLTIDNCDIVTVRSYNVICDIVTVRSYNVICHDGYCACLMYTT